MTDVIALLAEAEARVGAALPEILARRFEITWKPDGSPVTAADHWVERLLADLLHQHLPGLTFISEESWRPGAPLGAGWRAVLDPIDGTENFCSGLKEWGISLSIWQGEAHRGSLLMLPELGDSMATGRIPRVPAGRLIGLTATSHPALAQIVAEAPAPRMMGCAVYNLFNVVRGAYARFVNPKGGRSWDFLAGLALAREAGCDVIVNAQPYEGTFLPPDPLYCVDIRHRAAASAAKV